MLLALWNKSEHVSSTVFGDHFYDYNNAISFSSRTHKAIEEWNPDSANKKKNPFKKSPVVQI